LIKKFSSFLNLDQELCTDLYINYIDSQYNQFIISKDLIDKVNTDELFTAHFEKFLQFYKFERHAMLKNIMYIVNVTADSSDSADYNSKAFASLHCDLIRELFNDNDLKIVYKSCLKDYEQLSDIIKNANKRVYDSNITESVKIEFFNQTVLELELVLEILTVLVNTIETDVEMFIELCTAFTESSIYKYLSHLKNQDSIQNSINQIGFLHTVIIVKASLLDKLVHVSLDNQLNDESREQISVLSNQIPDKDKCKLASSDTKALINNLIVSFGSNYVASPIILAWTTLLYNLSIDESLSKVITSDLRPLINKYFVLVKKESPFEFLLNSFVLHLFKNEDILWHIKQIVYHLLTSVLHSFDESSAIGDQLKIVFELCFFCLNKNEVLCEVFWRTCNLEDRDNLTILMSHAIETFPISFRTTLTFMSLLARTSPKLCKDIIEYLTHMGQYCENYNDISQDEYVGNGEFIRLTRRRRLFGIK
jgi:hemoglobin-like flavoprotein